MSREEVIRIANNIAKNEYTASDISVLLLSYCIDRGKPYYESTLFVTFLLKNPYILMECISFALDYYYKEFDIYRLYTKANPVKNLILIY